MQVAQVSDFYPPRLGGIELHVADLADRQRRAGNTVRVLTSSPGPPEPGVVRLALLDGAGHALNPLAVRAGLRMLRNAEVDVVHAHVGVGSPLGFFMARAAARAGIPTVVTVHSLWTWVLPVLAAADAWGRWSRLPIVWTAVSEAAAAPVRRLLPGRPVRVIPNGIDQEGWRSGPAAPQPSAPLVAAAVMRLSLRKRPIPLLRMLRRANAALAPESALHLLVVGDGPMKSAMRAYAAWHGMASQLTLAGRLDREGVRCALRGAGLFLAPARLESFGIAALEARCAGLPVVALRSGGVGEFVADGHEGLLCTDDDEMVRAMVRLATDEQLRRRISSHNAETDTRIDWANVLELTDQAYRDAAFLQATAPHQARSRS